ncbi:MAG TPA: outer membrane lipoprotein-sorting protein [Ignavibacteriaceae bacterium]|nr:outer membrane lipoprotein-sorting protein [Ignavibacteriaceae bacterium]
MKNLVLSILMTMIFASLSFAQTVDEILEQHFAASGQEKLLATNTFMSKGKIMQMQFEIPFTSYHKRPMKFRSEAEFQGMKISSAYDGNIGWYANPMMGSSDPQPMTEEQIDQLKTQADYDGIFYNYKEKGYTVELIEKKTVDDIETYVLKLTRPNGDIITYYIDAENYVLLKSESKIKMQGVETESETIFSNYKFVNEILIAHSMETKVNGETMMQMVFEEITYDVEIPDSMFEMPAAEEQPDSTDSE